MSKKQDDGRRTLVVKRETMRELTHEELGRAAGGARNNCTARISGCISRPG